jgi:type I restriction enzyme M protein
MKFNQDYLKLLEYTKELNDLLHTKKIKEAQRSLLISGILIALQNTSF